LGIVASLIVSILCAFDFRVVAVVLFTVCVTMIFTIKALVSATSLEVAQDAIVFFHPLGLVRRISLSKISDVTATNKGFSIFALAKEKVVIRWMTDNKKHKAVFSPENTNRFIDIINNYMSRG
jgi:hypothetical protein